MKHYTKDNFMLASSVGYLINKSRNLLIAEMDGALRDLDITSQQMGIMLSLQHQIATTPFELSKLLSIDTGLMTRLLDKLESKGLLKRSRNLEDRRVTDLALTSAGVAVAKQIPDIAPPVLNARLKRFSKAEFEEFCRLLRLFLDE